MKSYVLFLILWLAGCVTGTPNKDVAYSLHLDTPQHLRFQGKGAAAGIMMSSSMGPMGVAIGVAIDEGIAKDLQRALEDAGCQLDSVVTIGIERALLRHGARAIKIFSGSSLNAQVAIQIERIGYRLLPGEGDRVFVEIKAGLVYGGMQTNLDFPPESLRQQYSIGFDQAKGDGKLSCELLQNTLTDGFAHWYEQAVAAKP